MFEFVHVLGVLWNRFSEVHKWSVAITARLQSSMTYGSHAILAPLIPLCMSPTDPQ